MPKILPKAPRVDIDFTDVALTGHGGSSFLGALARELGLPDQPASTIRIKQRIASDLNVL